MKKFTMILLMLFIGSRFHAQAPVFGWAKQIGGILDEIGYSVTSDSSGNIYITGTFKGTVDFDPGAGVFDLTSAGDTDVFVAKLDASGNFIWAKKIGNAFPDGSFSIASDALGNTFIAGSFDDTVDFDPGAATVNLISAGNSDIFILKLDALGNYIWAKNVGSTSVDYALSATIDIAGNVYTTGVFTGTVDFDPAAAFFNLTADGEDVFILKLDASGNFVWAKNVGGAGSDSGRSVYVDSLYNVYIAGSFQATVDFDPGAGTANLTCYGTYSTFILKLDNNGNFVWVKNLGENAPDVTAMSVAVDPSGNVYSTGYLMGGTGDFDPGAAVYNLTCTAGSDDTFISKLDASGNFVWAKNIQSGSVDIGRGIALDFVGDVYITGNFYGTGDFDTGSGVYTLNSPGLSAYILKLNSLGNFVWARNIEGLDGSTDANGITVNTSGSIYTTGWFYLTSDFNTDAGTGYLSSYYGWDVFVHKMNQTGVGIEENSDTDFFFTYPNPNNGSFNLVLSAMINSAAVEIYNDLGALVYQRIIVSKDNAIDLSDQSNGLYFVKVLLENKLIATQKIVKQ